MTERERQVLELIKKNPEISQQEIADLLDITRSSAAVHISNLMKKGKIRGKGYILNEEDYVCVVGAVNVDIIATSFNKLKNRDSNPGFVKYSFGGVGRNIAENLSRLDVSVEMITVLGDDIYATKLVENCNNLGISLRHSLRVTNENTSTYICLNNDDGEMELAISAMNIYEKLTPEYLSSKLDIINKAKVVVLDTNISKEAIEYLVTNCTAKIFIDPVSTTKSEKIKPFLNRIHTIKPNLLETELLLDIKIKNEEDIEKAGQLFLEKGVKNVFISLGEKGVYFIDESNSGSKNNYKSRIVNTTGCGDAFMAGVVYAYLQDYDIEKSSEIGLRASKVCIESSEAVSKEMNVNLIDKGEN